MCRGIGNYRERSDVGTGGTTVLIALYVAYKVSVWDLHYELRGSRSHVHVQSPGSNLVCVYSLGENRHSLQKLELSQFIFPAGMESISIHGFPLLDFSHYNKPSSASALSQQQILGELDETLLLASPEHDRKSSIQSAPFMFLRSAID